MFKLFLSSDRPDPPQGQPKVTELTTDSVRVEWRPPTHDGGTSVTSYHVEWQAGDSGDWTTIGCTHVMYLHVHDLQHGTEYRFRVLAENVFGTSDPSDTSDAYSIQEPKAKIDYDKMGKKI